MVCHPVRTEDRLGDIAVTGAVHMAVDGPEHVTGAAALLDGQASVAGDLAAEQGAQQPVDGREAVGTVGVEGHQGGQRLARSPEPQDLKPVAVAEVVMEMSALTVGFSGAVVERLEKIATVRQIGRRADQQDGRGEVRRCPENVGVDGAEAGRNWEIVAPRERASSLWSAFGAQECSFRHDCGNPAGNVRCAAAIPRRGRTERSYRHSHRKSSAIWRYPESSATPRPVTNIPTSRYWDYQS